MPGVFPLDALATYIGVDLGIGAVGTVVFRNYMPDDQAGKYDTIVAIYESGGSPPALTMGDDTDYPSFQVMSRSLTAATARTNLQTIFQALHGLHETDIHGVHFKLIEYKQSAPVPLGRDERQRFQFSQSFGAAVRGVTR